MKITACSIVKNEEKNIVRSIQSYKNAVDEIIIVDTGSTDRTVELCEGLGAKVLHYKWDNDFASAKNTALEAATGDWVIFLDADEWFEPALERKAFLEALKQVEDNPLIDLLKVKFFNIEEHTNTIISSTVIGRIFRNSSELRFKGKIHEEIKKGTKMLGVGILENLQIYHTGYSKDRVADKCERNLTLLKKAYEKGEIDPHLYFYLCRENLLCGNHEEADKFCELFLAQENVDEMIAHANVLVSIYEYNIKLKLKLNNKYTIKEVKVAIDEALDKYPQIPLHYYLEGCYYVKFDSLKALESFKKAQVLQENYKLDYINNFDAHQYDNYYQIASIYEGVQRYNEALEYSVLALQNKPLDSRGFALLIQLLKRENAVNALIILKKIYNMQDENHVKFLAHQLMTTKSKELFLQFAIRYNQNFNGQDETTYIAMLLAGQIDNMVGTAVQAYLNGGRKDDQYFIALGILYGKRKDLFDKYKSYLDKNYVMIVNRYLSGDELLQPTDEELRAWMHLYDHLFWCLEEREIEDFEAILPYKTVDITKAMLEKSLATHDYNYILDRAEKIRGLIQEPNIRIQLDRIIAISYFYTGDYEKSIDAFGLLINSQKVDIDIKVINCLQALSRLTLGERYRDKVEKLYTIYRNAVYQSILIAGMLTANKVEELPDLEDQVDIVELSVDAFDDYLKNEESKLPEFYLMALSGLMEAYLNQRSDKKVIDLLVTFIRNDFNREVMMFKLAEAFNRIGKSELAYYCHKKVFELNKAYAQIAFRESENINKDYIYEEVDTTTQKLCPLCGRETKLESIYSSLWNPEFSRNYPVIKKWRYCEGCIHRFQENIPVGSPKEELTDSYELSPKKILLGQKMMEKVKTYKKQGSLFILGSNTQELQLLAEEYGYVVEGINAVEDVKEVLPSKKYDIIILSNGIEKSKTPKELLEKIGEMLNKGGILSIKTPNFKSAYAKIEKDKCLENSKPSLYNYFSRQSLESMIRSIGLEALDYEASIDSQGYMIITAIK
ncbi:hypothetical protein CS063_06640 [Sporanaerobium hydrogeniformans]|uniref:Uncharacterized protein n=1 Tax=Sporanaerobium hydrogeniformans TaxID=3072179 RepID=A0AC61DEY1_9FIRM|nr:glycosyltransferase [Sporanaerobium hydrogeniformans]PHV71363.1 hypothetical protein CS063_06640 [Sporanaerobium hydrogeniformans]